MFQGLLSLLLFVLPLTGARADDKQLLARELFVRWDPAVPQFQRDLAYREHRVRQVWSSSLVPGLERVRPRNGAQDPDGCITRLGATPGVVYVQPDYRIHRKLQPRGGLVHPTTGPKGDKLSPNDPYYAKQWGLKAGYGTAASTAWDITTGSREVRVAVIDTGVDGNHPELMDRMGPGYDVIDKTEKVTDRNGHGTHVAGVIGAATSNGVGIAGVSPLVTLIPIRAVPNDGDEADSDVISAIEFAVRAGARIANLSFAKDQASIAVKDTLLAAGEKGLFVVVAAGNDSQNNGQYPKYPGNFRTPNMVVVAALDKTGNLAWFSNYGIGVVDLAAPGEFIPTTHPGNRYGSLDGTSLAAPHVSGIAALALAANPSLTIEQLRSVILNGVTTDVKLKGKLVTHGRANAASTLKLAVSLR